MSAIPREEFSHDVTMELKEFSPGAEPSYGNLTSRYVMRSRLMPRMMPVSNVYENRIRVELWDDSHNGPLWSSCSKNGTVPPEKITSYQSGRPNNLDRSAALIPSH